MKSIKSKKSIKSLKSSKVNKIVFGKLFLENCPWNYTKDN